MNGAQFESSLPAWPRKFILPHPHFSSLLFPKNDGDTSRICVLRSPEQRLCFILRLRSILHMEDIPAWGLLVSP